jgi:hypothetical protein
MFSGDWVDRHGQIAEEVCKNVDGMEGVEQARRYNKAERMGKRARVKKLLATKVGMVLGNPHRDAPGQPHSGVGVFLVGLSDGNMGKVFSMPSG